MEPLLPASPINKPAASPKNPGIPKNGPKLPTPQNVSVPSPKASGTPEERLRSSQSLSSLVAEHQLKKEVSPSSYEMLVKEDAFKTFEKFYLSAAFEDPSIAATLVFHGTFPQSNFEEKQKRLKRIWEDYRDLYAFHSQGSKKSLAQVKAINEKRDRFAADCFDLATDFNSVCGEKIQSAWDPIFSEGMAKRYRDEIHPQFRTFQRLMNFFFHLWEKEGKGGSRRDFGIIEIDTKRCFAYFLEEEGYLPIPFVNNPADLEMIYLHYGSAAANPPPHKGGQLYIYDKMEQDTHSGFILELQKIPAQGVQFVIRGYYGANTATPFCTEEVVVLAPPNAVPKTMQIKRLVELFKQDIAKFEASQKEKDILFFPFPEEDEQTKMNYLLIEELVAKSKNMEKPEEQKLALEWIAYIEQMEGKPISDVQKEAEQAVMEEIASEYDREIAQQQQSISQQVSEGNIVGKAREHAKKDKPTNRKHKSDQKSHKFQSEPTLDQAQQQALRKKEIQNRFDQLRANGRIKYRSLLKIAKTVLKEHPTEFQKENKKGSHKVLHFDSGPASLVKIHGTKDSSMSKHYANRVIKNILNRATALLTPEPSSIKIS